MAVSVRMEALLERELELAAQRRGISKSQFIIEAVEGALGHKDPGKLLLQVREEFAPMRAAEAAAGGAVLPPGSHAERLRALLRARHEAHLTDWAQRQAVAAPPAARAARPKPAAPTAKRKGRAA
jgi:hypothetical protein